MGVAGGGGGGGRGCWVEGGGRGGAGVGGNSIGFAAKAGKYDTQ